MLPNAGYRERGVMRPLSPLAISLLWGSECPYSIHDTTKVPGCRLGQFPPDNVIMASAATGATASFREADDAVVPEKGSPVTRTISHLMSVVQVTQETAKEALECSDHDWDKAMECLFRRDDAAISSRATRVTARLREADDALVPEKRNGYRTPFLPRHPPARQLAEAMRTSHESCHRAREAEVMYSA